jgi:phosphocarrier protein
MVERTVKVINRAGVHARPSSLIVQETNKYKSSVHFEHDGDKINAKSILGVITLGACYGAVINVSAEGEDEEELVNAIEKLFAAKFAEE